MSYLVVSGVMLSCSYGTCLSKFKVTPLRSSGSSSASPPSFSIPNGLVKTFDINGKLMSKSLYVKGTLHGPSLSFNSSGQITQKLMFAAGKVHGAASMYTNGVLAASVSFKNGFMSGASSFYNAKGKLALQTNFPGGLEHGLRVSFDVNTGAILKREVFAKGAFVGTLKVGFRGALKLVKSAVNAQANVQGNLQGALPTARGGLAAIAGALPAMGAGLDMGLGLDLNIDGLASVDGALIATIHDHKPGINIRPFCSCTSSANPAVAAATKAAQGVLQPQPCTPKTLSPWIPGYHGATLQNHPVLTDKSQLICAYGGIIRIADSGQKKATIV